MDIKSYIYPIFLIIMKKFSILLLLFFVFQTITAQYTEIINSKRPGFSESPYGVGTNVFQVEGGIFYQKLLIDKMFDTSKSFGTNVYLRYGKFSERLEFNLDLSYQKDERVFYNVITPTYFYDVSGISKLRFGIKYLIYNQKYTDKSKEVRSWKKRTSFDYKRLIPSIGVYVGVNPNFLSTDFKEQGVSLKGALLLQNDLSNRFVILTNLYANKILLDNLEYGYIFTATYALNDKWSIFGENQGVFNKYENTYQFGGGTAYLVNNNVQLDLSVRGDLLANETNYYIALGGSWRLDRHVKKPKSADVLQGEKQGSFFSRLFKKKKRGKKYKKSKIKHKKRRVKKAKKGTPSFFKKKKK